jgi:hypothetical protein
LDAHERYGKQQESGQGKPDRDLLMPREQAQVPADAQECEHGDARRTDGLHQAERCKPKRGDVDEPTGGLGGKADHPASASQ